MKGKKKKKIYTFRIGSQGGLAMGLNEEEALNGSLSWRTSHSE